MPASALPPGATLSDVGEFGLIDALLPTLGTAEHVLLGAGDDAAVLRVRGHVVVSTDVAVEQRHFRRDWATALEIGHKVSAAALSDINAMGGVPHSVTVALAAPADLPAQWALDLMTGIVEECRTAGAVVVGGDLTRAEEVMVAVTVMGGCEVAPVARSGASIGDVVALRGRQGWAAAGLAVLARGFRSPRVLVEAYKRPEPPYGDGLAGARAGATAMIDVSDGLLADVGHIARASGLAIDVDPTAFDLADPMHAVGAALGVDPMSFVLGGGDDHPLVATFPEGAVPEGWTLIGRCVEGSGVTVAGEEFEGTAGHTHF